MSTEDLKLPNDLDQLKAIIARQSEALAEREAVIGRHEVVIVQREAVIASQHEVIEKQLKKLERMQQELARLLRRQYGPQKERIDPNQLTLFTAEEIAELIQELQRSTVDSVSTDDGRSGDESLQNETAADASAKKTKDKGHGRRPIPPQIPRETIVHELSDGERLCPCCGKLRNEIGREVSEQLEFVPAQLKAIRHERVRYACQACEENISLAPKPAQPIDKGLPGPGLLAYLTLSKYGDYLPLYRLEDILSRGGILLRRSTLCGWIANVADLVKPVYDLMCDRVQGSRVIHTDDTGIKMLSEGQCQNCKFWTYVGDPANPYAVYEFSLTREGKNPSRFLEDFAGYLQADAFSGYDQVYSKGRVIEVACMAHCRRYWWEARETNSRHAHEAIGYIARLYQLEAEFEKALLTGDALRAARQQHAIPLLNAFEIWLKKEQANVLPKSPAGQAFTYVSRRPNDTSGLRLKRYQLKTKGLLLSHRVFFFQETCDGNDDGLSTGYGQITIHQDVARQWDVGASDFGFAGSVAKRGATSFGRKFVKRYQSANRQSANRVGRPKRYQSANRVRGGRRPILRTSFSQPLRTFSRGDSVEAGTGIGCPADLPGPGRRIRF